MMKYLPWVLSVLVVGGIVFLVWWAHQRRKEDLIRRTKVDKSLIEVETQVRSVAMDSATAGRPLGLERYNR